MGLPAALDTLLNQVQMNVFVFVFHPQLTASMRLLMVPLKS